MTLHLLKLCVGVAEISELQYWIDRRAAEAVARGEPPRHRHITRQRPRRGDEVLDGGSLYWVIKGLIQVRQRIVDLRDVTGEDGIRRCAIILAPTLVGTRPVPRRAFQGWRYLEAGDAPADLGGDSVAALPAELRRELAGLGLL
ncbi:hypothetical protein MNBD_ALPHA09-1056 [hydrothermal vent metagenome]|uniref:DUF1489 family protein n=1 Tax=hydrothermal vent metagenome TaxID=652676 RepID=A0A3B0T075_9ZZZZ